MFRYVLSTGANWAGPIGSGTITVKRATKPPIWFENPEDDRLKPAVPGSSAGDVFRWEFKDYEPADAAEIEIYIGLSRSDRVNEDVQDIGWWEVMYRDAGLPLGDNMVGVTAVAGLGFRKEPDPAAATVPGRGTLEEGVYFEILWWRVRLAEGAEGWLRWRYVDPDTGGELIYARFFLEWRA